MLRLRPEARDSSLWRDGGGDGQIAAVTAGPAKNIRNEAPAEMKNLRVGPSDSHTPRRSAFR
ncbi:MAG: hypothetical protein IIA67_10030 [Planctomycetes bacterium]|nr:hypothetical protein [Planctomycetota bacterium]